MSNKRPIKDLEEQFTEARSRHLIADIISNPHLSQCYILITFHESTKKKVRIDVLKYIQKTYDIIDAQLIPDENSLYIVYDYWSRYFDSK